MGLFPCCKLWLVCEWLLSNPFLKPLLAEGPRGLNLPSPLWDEYLSQILEVGDETGCGFLLLQCCVAFISAASSSALVPEQGWEEALLFEVPGKSITAIAHEKC